MKKTGWKSVAGLVGIAIALVAGLLAGCGDDDDDSGGDSGPSTSKATLVIPFPSCVGFYPPFVAEARGYFADNGIDVEVQPVDGGGAALQAMLGGRADVALVNFFDIVQSVDEGAPLQAFYALNQEPAFSLFVPADSPLKNVEDLGDQTVGISTPGAGDATNAEMELAAAGLEGNELLAVGGADGGLVALRKGDVAAYSATFFESIIMEQQTPLRALVGPDFPEYAGTLLVSTKDWISDNRDFVVSFGRSWAKATAWAQDHLDEVLDICGEAFPDETQNRELAQALLEATFEETALPPEANGQFGLTQLDAAKEATELLVEVGKVSKAPPSDTFTNKFVEDFNSSGD